mmetsp:Transcript_36423/g.58747  ORF Transcript_36423/g.58747 Transcript_36423/m.58747 type:complete len:98 (+) Transcript_36423:636-929(+)
MPRRLITLLPLGRLTKSDKAASKVTGARARHDDDFDDAKVECCWMRRASPSVGEGCRKAGLNPPEKATGSTIATADAAAVPSASMRSSLLPGLVAIA